MIKFEHIEVFGVKLAIRGMRNPLASWDRSDSREEAGRFVIGAADLELARKLYRAGAEHRKYMRQIMVSMDITAPLYWWKEYDTYKVGTAANSCSTMHTIHKKEFTLDDFSHEHLEGEYLAQLYLTIRLLNRARERFLGTKDKRYWWQMIQLLPSSYNQMRTVTFSFENAVAMIHQREGHKLDEWRELVEILRGLPYLSDIIAE